MIDYSTPLGRVRLLITDMSDVSGDRLFTDDQLAAFLSLHTDNVYRAAAQALRVIAASEVLTSKVIRTQAGTSTDGAKVSAELRALAAAYEAQADTAETSASSFFEIVAPEVTTGEGVEWSS